MKLKIGILGTRGIPNHYGGFEQFAEQLSVGLVHKGHEVYVYNSSLHPFKAREWNGVRIIHCADWEDKIGTAGQFIYDWNCINDSRKRNFDVLLHLGYTSDSIWHRRWPRRTVNLVNMDGLEWQRSKYNGPTRRFLLWAESLAAKNAHTLIADSPAIQDYLYKKYQRKPVHISYGAEVFSDPDASILSKYGLTNGEYFLLIARMEPENNIEMIIKGYLESKHVFPLFIIGNISNKHGQYLRNKYRDRGLIYTDALYDQAELDNLRYHCSLYFHGHSVGGTNPSLLEAMACGSAIAAHGNQFNRSVLQDDADYFSSSLDVASIISQIDIASTRGGERQQSNIEKVRTAYSRSRIVDAYESLMLDCCGVKKLILEPVAANAV